MGGRGLLKLVFLLEIICYGDTSSTSNELAQFCCTVIGGLLDVDESDKAFRRQSLNDKVKMIR